MKRHIAIIVLNYNGKPRIKACLDSIGVSRLFKVSEYVVDNNSVDNSVAIVRKYFPSAVILQNKSNLGWSGGNNVGIRDALNKKADAVLLLNNDVVLTNNAIDILGTKLFSNRRTGIVGPKTLYPNSKSRKNILADAGGMMKKHRYFGINRGQGQEDIGLFDQAESVDFISGSAMMIKTSVFQEIGLFDERFFLYYEDADFCFRAKSADFRVMFISNAVVYHQFAATAKIGSPLHHYYTTRNHYLFVEKQAPFSVKLREFLRTPKTATEFFLSPDAVKKKYSLLGIRDYYLRRLGKRQYW